MIYDTIPLKSWILLSDPLITPRSQARKGFSYCKYICKQECLCPCVLIIETAKFEAFKQRSGLHIEVPSVYGWQAVRVTIWGAMDVQVN